MSKKKKKKGNKVRALRSFGGYGSNGKNDKHTKANKKERKLLKNGKHLDNSLSKKKAKKIRKFANRYPEMPDAIAELRAECNHACDVISVEEYRQLPNHYNPTLDLLVDAFGESDVVVCKDCFEPLLDKSVITEANLKAAVATIIGTVNYITPRVKMSEKELRKHYEKKQKLMNLMGTLMDELKEAYDRDDMIEQADQVRARINEQRSQGRGNDNNRYKPSSVTNLAGNNGFVRDDSDEDED